MLMSLRYVGRPAHARAGTGHKISMVSRVNAGRGLLEFFLGVRRRSLLQSKVLRQGALVVGVRAGGVVLGCLYAAVVVGTAWHPVGRGGQQFVGNFAGAQLLRAGGEMLVDITIAVGHLLDQLRGHAEMTADLFLIAGMAVLQFFNLFFQIGQFRRSRFRASGDEETNDYADGQTANCTQPNHTENPCWGRWTARTGIGHYRPESASIAEIGGAGDRKRQKLAAAFLAHSWASGVECHPFPGCTPPSVADDHLLHEPSATLRTRSCRRHSAGGSRAGRGTAAFPARV